MNSHHALVAAAAAASTISASPIYQAIRDDIITPILYLVFAFALLVFIWGVIGYLWALRRGDVGDGKKKGQDHMIWGAVGMAIMISVFGIMQFIWGTLASLPGGSTGWNGQPATPPSEINGL